MSSICASSAVSCQALPRLVHTTITRSMMAVSGEETNQSAVNGIERLAHHSWKATEFWLIAFYIFLLAANDNVSHLHISDLNLTKIEFWIGIYTGYRVTDKMRSR